MNAFRSRLTGSDSISHHPAQPSLSFALAGSKGGLMSLAEAADAVEATKSAEAGPLPLVAFFTPTRLLLARSAMSVVRGESCASSLIVGAMLVSAAHSCR